MQEYIQTREGLLNYLGRFYHLIVRLDELNTRGMELYDIVYEPDRPYRRVNTLQMVVRMAACSALTLSLVLSFYGSYYGGFKIFFIIPAIIAYFIILKKLSGNPNAQRHALSIAGITAAITIPLGNMSSFVFTRAYLPALVVGFIAGLIVFFTSKANAEEAATGKNGKALMIGLATSAPVFYVASAIMLLSLSDDTVAFFYLVLLVCLALGVVAGFLWTIIARAKDIAYNKEVEVYNAHLQQIRPQSAQEIATIEAELRSLNQQYVSEGMDQFPPNYTDAQTISTLYNLVKNYRASTLQEAVNIYEEDLHRHRMEMSQLQILEGQQQMIEEEQRTRKAVMLTSLITNMNIAHQGSQIRNTLRDQGAMTRQTINQAASRPVDVNLRIR
ncbi:MAG: hypothetical protein Q4P78_08375 [Rothia sp. (in: high G+C Gram-positive bacteria)]|uniref:hypothetical protein n=1 Tax=Rothia sp. (in: high G+C Gram-positive bacteria) TaxID=1885016 RepID=UPI0026DEF776|nr:hypothetical protein [Rothia sp. (in: high G+C Gram-positive bacteria)]MDO5751190.1 hypothetical protein [Rothia sp. (in: high G+C Gram-positive bacteria)]